MDAEQLLERIERQQGTAEARLLFGEPVTQGSRTVVPVARVVRGFGWGLGGGRQRGETDGEQDGWGGGNGGFLRARPVAVLDVTPERGPGDPDRGRDPHRHRGHGAGGLEPVLGDADVAR